jgi:hypothetical protein
MFNFNTGPSVTPMAPTTTTQATSTPSHTATQICKTTKADPATATPPQAPQTKSSNPRKERRKEFSIKCREQAQKKKASRRPQTKHGQSRTQKTGHSQSLTPTPTKKQKETSHFTLPHRQHTATQPRSTLQPNAAPFQPQSLLQPSTAPFQPRVPPQQVVVPATRALANDIGDGTTFTYEQ